MTATNWKGLAMETDAELLKKEWFTYRIGGEQYEIELFENQQGEFYAIGTPADKTKIYVYGSSIVADPTLALAQTIKKINREQMHSDIFFVGEDVHDSQEED